MKKTKIIILWAFLVIVWLFVMFSIDKYTTDNKLANDQNKSSQVVTWSIAEVAVLARDVEATRQQMTVDSLDIAENNKAIKALEEENKLLRSWYNMRYKSVKDSNEKISDLLWL